MRASRSVSGSPASVDASTAPVPSSTTAASICEEISVRSARADVTSTGQTILPASGRVPAVGATLAKFFADSGAAPRRDDRVLRRALLRLADLPRARAARLHRPREESSYLVEELRRLFPSQSIEDIVEVVGAITENATTLGLIGGAFLLWTSLSLFSVLESAFNIVYERPNRPFLRGKFLATLFMAGSIVILSVVLVAGSISYDLIERFAPGVVDNRSVAYGLSVTISTLAVFVFLVAAYERLTNAHLRLREVWLGAALAAVLLQATFQVLPIFVRLSRDVVAVQALGTSALLLVWIYVDGERDRLRRRGELVVRAPRRGRDRRPRVATDSDWFGGQGGGGAGARWELAHFQAFPSSATVRVSPAGTKTGS